MRIRSVAALALVALFSFPIAASAITGPSPAPMKMNHKKAINSKVPGSPGYTNSSPLGSAQKKAKKAAKKKAAAS